MIEPKSDPMIARDLVGYGEFPPNPAWPGGALIAVNFNLNIEGGGEASLANGDDVSEGMLNDIGVPTQVRRRVPLVESIFEYGSRRGAWRVLDIFRDFSVGVSVLGVARALEQNPETGAGLRRARPRDCFPRLSLDRLRRRARGRRTRSHPPRNRYSGKTYWRATGRLDDRATGPEHASAYCRGRRISVRPRFSCGRTALLAAN